MNVSIDNYRGKIRLRWTVDKQRYSLGLRLDYTELNLKVGDRTARQIEIDILAGVFDPTLDKYRLDPVGHTPRPRVPSRPKASLLTLWGDWVATLDLSQRTQCRDYDRVKAWLTRESVTFDNITLKFKALDCAPSTYNKNRSYCRKFLNWCVESNFLSSNPIASLKRRRQSSAIADNRKPYTVEEIRLILDAFATDQFHKPCSRYPHSHYLGFVTFLFLTGCRVSEAIGIRVKDVNLAENTIEISTVLARSDKGLSSAKHRVRKECKTGNSRQITINAQLKAVAIAAMSGKPSKDLLFKTHLGNAIDDNSWRFRVFKPIVEQLGLQYRCIHAIRHSAASRWLKAGVPLPDVSEMLGHADPSITLKIYSHVLGTPTLPEL